MCFSRIPMTSPLERGATSPPFFEDVFLQEVGAGAQPGLKLVLLVVPDGTVGRRLSAHAAKEYKFYAVKDFIGIVKKLNEKRRMDESAGQVQPRSLSLAVHRGTQMQLQSMLAATRTQSVGGQDARRTAGCRQHP